MFSCEYCEIFKSTYFEEQLQGCYWLYNITDKALLREPRVYV